MEQVLKKVKEWEEAGYLEEVQEQPWWTNPLSVVVKEDLETKEVKKRVVLETSRHLSKNVIKQTVQMEDLKATGAIMAQGKYTAVFDLENQFFHVKLAEEVKQLFGLAVEVEGQEKFYMFNIMVYGFSPAVAVVTKLIKPLQSYLQCTWTMER